MCIRYWRSCRPSACLYVCYVDNGRKIRYDTSYTRKTEQTLCVYVFSSCTKIDFTLPFRICSNELLLMSSALASMRFNSNWLNFWFLSFFEDLWTWLANDLRNEKKTVYSTRWMNIRWLLWICLSLENLTFYSTKKILTRFLKIFLNNSIAFALLDQ